MPRAAAEEKDENAMDGRNRDHRDPRPATGGDEGGAVVFAPAKPYSAMYERYAARQGWKDEVMTG